MVIRGGRYSQFLFYFFSFHPLFSDFATFENVLKIKGLMKKMRLKRKVKC